MHSPARFRFETSGTATLFRSKCHLAVAVRNAEHVFPAVFGLLPAPHALHTVELYAHDSNLSVAAAVAACSAALRRARSSRDSFLKLRRSHIRAAARDDNKSRDSGNPEIRIKAPKHWCAACCMDVKEIKWPKHVQRCCPEHYSSVKRSGKWPGAAAAASIVARLEQELAQRVLSLRFDDGLSVKETADIVGSTEAGSKTR
jgi:hypothetical protein